MSDLERELSKLISPYEVRDFTVLVTVDGKRLELAEITSRIRDSAQVRYRLDFDGQLFKVSGKARLAFFRPDSGKEDLDDFRTGAEMDGGEVDSFNLGRLQSSEQNVFDKVSEYKNYIKDHSGVRVYRDGFGIRVDHD